MSSPQPVDPEILRRMRETIASAIASRRTSISEAAAEARGLGRGLQPTLPAGAIDAAISDLLRSLGACLGPPVAVERDSVTLRPAAAEEVADALAFTMRFDERGKARRTGVEFAAKLAAEQMVRHLLASGFVVMRGPPPRPRDAG